VQHDERDDAEHDRLDEAAVDAHEVGQRSAFVVVLELDQLRDLGHAHEPRQLKDAQQLVEAREAVEDQAEGDRRDEVEEEVAEQVVLGDEPAVGYDSGEPGLLFLGVVDRGEEVEHQVEQEDDVHHVFEGGLERRDFFDEDGEVGHERHGVEHEEE
jgi:hypothetical protein